MSRSLITKFFYTLITFSLVIGTQTGRAEDTEIYFSSGGGTDENTIRPNVLFILDTSGSMDNELSGDPDDRSRIAVLRSTMSEIISNIQNVNLGLMRFTYNDGGPVLFPITFIDETLDNVVGANLEDAVDATFDYSRVASEDAVEDVLTGSATVGTVTTNNTSGFEISRIAAVPPTSPGSSSGFEELRLPNNNSDAEEDTDDSTNNMSGSSFGLQSSVLKVDPDNMVGLRYTMTPGTIPMCSDIKSNTNLRLRVYDDDSGSQEIKVWGQDSDSTAVFTETHQGLSSRPDTTAMVIWDPPAFNDNNFWTNLDTGHYETSTRLEDVIEEIVNRGCSAIGANDGTWDESSIVIFMEQNAGSNDRDFYSRNESNWRAPRLQIDWEKPGATTIAGTPAEQSLIAVRFEDIDLPQGADVTSAKLNFHPSVDASSGTPTWRIYAEDVDNSASLAATTNNLSTRFTNKTSAYAEWSVPAWTEDEIISTTNTNTSQTLEDVLEELVGRTNWCGGNDITLLIQSQGDGNLRYADSLETESDAFELEFSYSSSASDGCFEATDSKQAEVSQDDAQQDGTNANADINEASIPIASQTSGFRFSDIDVPKNATIISANIEFTSIVATTASTDVTITGELPSDGDADEFAYEIDNITDRLSGDTAGVTWSLPTTLSAEDTFTTPTDFKNVVQAVVNNANWVSGNAMSFLFSPATTGTHAVYARDGDANKAAKLTVTYQSSGAVVTKTARDRMIELVEGLPSSDHTPILDTLYEAAQYWRGDHIVFGKDRWGDNDSALSHPGSYCSKDGSSFDCNGATIDSDTNEFGVDYEGSCDPTDISDWESNDCDNTYIKGSPKYISPITTESTCQNNYQIFLTDGETYDTDADQQGEITSEYGLSCRSNNSNFKTDSDSALTYTANPNDHVEKCAVDLVEYLATQDIIDDTIIDNDQHVRTSTVAFDLSDAQYMKDLANIGNGEFYEATSATDLTNIFESFLEDVRSEPTSFVAPSLATNAFNRLLSRDEVYFGLFTPEFDERWLGNVKKYRICVDTDDFGGCTLGAIYDDDDNLAIDATTNRFDDNARSVWTASGTDDGVETTKGGAGAEVTDYSGSDGVTIYTEIGGNSTSGTQIASGTSLNTAGYVYSESSTSSDDWAANALKAMRARICNPPPPTPVSLAHADAADCEDRMKWLLGKRIVGEPDSDISSNQRWSNNDVLHSSPIVITYGGADTSTPADGTIDVFYDKLVFGTNDGALHMINGIDGSENWRFIPNELMQQQRDMFDDATGDHLYGLDVTPVIRTIDNDGDGILETADSDKAIVYQAMRRGGNVIYALDVSGTMTSATSSITPKFLWSITGGSAGFERLADTWSRPELATISTSTGTKEVLIFGGGYDDNLDNADEFGVTASSGQDNNGNAIYIVDADDGDLILSIAGENVGASACVSNCPNIKVSNMRYSIPSRITVLDSDGDGIDDRLYVGDTAGQVWRVDLGNDILATGGITAAGTCEADASCSKTIVGRLASIANATGTITTASTVEANRRRFYEPPSVVQVADTDFGAGVNAGNFDYILIGSGYRAHPLNEGVDDRFYAFRDKAINGMIAASGSNLAQDYPKTLSAPISHSATDELIDITTTTLEAVETVGVVNVDAALGWYFDFNISNTSGGTVVDPGEKVLSAPITIAGTVFFTTYLPTESSDSDVCTGAQIGSGRAYNFDIITTKAVKDWDGTGNDVTGRVTTLGGGIPSDVVPVFTEEGVVGIVGIEGGATQLGTLSGLPRFKTYWYEES